MVKLKEFFIPFSGLKQGKHKFEYKIENKFFESFEYNEFNNADIVITVEMNKMSTIIELEMKADGIVNVVCDVSSEAYDQPIHSKLNLMVNFGEEFNDENDEILIIPNGEHQINVSQYLYEMLVLAVPSKRIHPGVLDGTLKSKAVDMLYKLQPKEEKENKQSSDPRWDALKKLITDK